MGQLRFKTPRTERWMVCLLVAVLILFGTWSDIAKAQDPLESGSEYDSLGSGSTLGDTIGQQALAANQLANENIITQFEQRQLANEIRFAHQTHQLQIADLETQVRYTEITHQILQTQLENYIRLSQLMPGSYGIDAPPIHEVFTTDGYGNYSVVTQWGTGYEPSLAQLQQPSVTTNYLNPPRLKPGDIIVYNHGHLQSIIARVTGPGNVGHTGFAVTEDKILSAYGDWRAGLPNVTLNPSDVIAAFVRREPVGIALFNITRDPSFSIDFGITYDSSVGARIEHSRTLNNLTYGEDYRVYRPIRSVDERAVLEKALNIVEFNRGFSLGQPGPEGIWHCAGTTCPLAVAGGNPLTDVVDPLFNSITPNMVAVSVANSPDYFEVTGTNIGPNPIDPSIYDAPPIPYTEWLANPTFDTYPENSIIDYQPFDPNFDLSIYDEIIPYTDIQYQLDTLPEDPYIYNQIQEPYIDLSIYDEIIPYTEYQYDNP